MRKIVISNFKDFLNESFNIDEQLSKYEKYQRLKDNKPIIIYRGIHKSGKNFYQGDTKLPFTYYSLDEDKARIYGDVHKFIFNEKSLPIKLFKGSDLFGKFGLVNIENKNVIDTLIAEGYSAILVKGNELIVLDESLVRIID